jgi:excisionase family DNA binding protein
MTTGREYLRAGDIAQLTGVSLRTARRWIAKEILASRKLGGARLVAKRELERLLSPSRELDNGEIDDSEECQ